MHTVTHFDMLTLYFLPILFVVFACFANANANAVGVGVGVGGVTGSASFTYYDRSVATCHNANLFRF